MPVVRNDCTYVFHVKANDRVGKIVEKIQTRVQVRVDSKALSKAVSGAASELEMELSVAVGRAVENTDVDFRLFSLRRCRRSMLPRLLRQRWGGGIEIGVGRWGYC
jgi:hypothetical protein